MASPFLKKALWLILSLLLIFILLVYLSAWEGDQGYDTAILVDIEDLEHTDFTRLDSVVVIASTHYQGSGLKQLMQGENYRKAWTTPLKVPVIYLDTLFGGMRIVKEGGGTQTHSLRLKNPQGILYSLRSVDKDPSTHVPPIARSLGLDNIITDAISAAHPYGALLAASLSDAAGILHTHPRVVYVPEQEFLGEFKEKYGNRLFLLEYETESEENWTTLEDVFSIIETDDLQELKMSLGEQLSIDRQAFVRARLFDLLIGDWDRHAKQWGWVIQKKGEHYKALPLPGDRDNAFFKIGGVIPTILIHSRSIDPKIKSLKKELPYLSSQVYAVDNYFLHNTPRKIFLEEAENLQHLLTDQAIDQALKVWPEELRVLDGEAIAIKLKARRDELRKYAREFHQAISEEPLPDRPLKGSEDIELSPGLLRCFECDH